MLWYNGSVDKRYLTMQEAAETAGYSNPSTLHAAARKGELRTETFGPNARVTTQEWLSTFLQQRRKGEYRRGAPKPRRSGVDWINSPEWLNKEREADAAFAAGQHKVFDDMESFLADLDA